MAEDSNTPTAKSGGRGKIQQFIKKNKTLSIVLGAGGLYFVYRELSKNSGGGSEEVEGEAAVGGSYEGPVPLTRELSQEGVDEEINRVSEELREETREREEMEREHEESHVENEPVTEGGGADGGREPGEVEGPTTETGAGQSVTIHGRTFNGATSYRIANSGQTDGGKKYIEYVINFPGRQEHWQFFTATGNWRKVNNSATGPGSNKPPDHNPPANNKPGGGGGNKKPPRPKPKPPSISPAKPVPTPPPVQQQHPNAVKTANKCVNGGVGGHTAPAGYHLFCGSDGWIWRAPNS